MADGCAAEPPNLQIGGERWPLAAVFDQLVAYAGILDLGGTMLEVNEAPLVEGGLARADVVGRPFWDTPWWSHDRAVQDLIRGAVRSAADGRPIRFDVKARMAGGRLVPIDCQIAPLRDRRGRVHLLVASATDVSGREHAVRALAASERRARERLAELELIYNEAPVGLGMVDRDMRFMRVNQQLADINGASAEAHQARAIGTILPDLRSQLEPVLRRVFETGEPVLGVEVVGETPGRPGVERHWIEHFYPLLRADGGIDAVGIICEEATARRQAERQAEAHRREMERLALHDALTGLPNRALLADRAQQAMAAAKRDGARMALLMLDLDDFKLVNDSLGHAAGDTLLQHVACRLKTALREVDIVGRLGGDEFAVVTGSLYEPDAAAAVAERVLAALGEPVELMGRREPIRASLGIAVYPDDARRLGSLFRCADLALYESKGDGGRRATFFKEPMRERLRERERLERSLTRAVEHGDFRLELIARHAVADGRVVTLELAPLWQHPSLGLVPVREHLVFAERKGLAHPIAAWAVARMERLLGELAAQGSGLRVALALSPTQVADTALITAIVAALDRLDLGGEVLQVELLTGSGWSLRPEPVHAALARLVGRGVGIGLRGLGADHLAFRELRRLPLDSLIVEADLVHALGEELEAEAFLDAIAGLGRRLGKRVIACGVQTRAQLELLRAAGCEEAQGPYFAHARCAETAPPEPPADAPARETFGHVARSGRRSHP